VRHDELLQAAWGTTDPAYRGHLRSYIKLLRQKIEPEPHKPRYIRSRSRAGYLLAVSESPEAWIPHPR
jgi:DNA-binding response OmpR family regulator